LCDAACQFFKPGGLLKQSLYTSSFVSHKRATRAASLLPAISIVLLVRIAAYKTHQVPIVAFTTIKVSTKTSLTCFQLQLRPAVPTPAITVFRGTTRGNNLLLGISILCALFPAVFEHHQHEGIHSSHVHAVSGSQPQQCSS
jgi:hypothetical protein